MQQVVYATPGAYTRGKELRAIMSSLPTLTYIKHSSYEDTALFYRKQFRGLFHDIIDRLLG